MASEKHDLNLNELPDKGNSIYGEQIMYTKLKYFSALILLILLNQGITANAQSVADKAKEKMQNYAFTNGHWHLVNTSFDPKIWQYVTNHYYVKMSSAADGLMRENEWKKFKVGFEVDPLNMPALKEFKKNSTYFGTVLHTYNVETDEVVTNYFKASNSTWQITSASNTLSADAIYSYGNGEDSLGKYEVKTTVEKLSDTEHRLTTQRKYESLGFWFTVDQYHATKIPNDTPKGKANSES